MLLAYILNMSNTVNATLVDSNELVVIGTKQDKITSLELVKQINVFRLEEGRSELRHDTLLAIIRDEFEEEVSLQKILESNYSIRGKQYPMFKLTFNQAKQILFRESKLVKNN
jgi:anti-repressor protein